MKDHQYEKTDGNQVIEVLLEGNGVKVWAPAMALDLRVITKDRDIKRIKEIRVRDFKEEENE